MSLGFELWRRAQDSIAQGALTNSKHPDRFPFGSYPTHVVGGRQCYLYDDRARQFTDYICGLGTNLLGYGNPLIYEHLVKNLSLGFSHSLPTIHEIETAEKLSSIFVFADKWKFLKTGTEACMAAIKMARAATGRDLVLSEAYHGWSDDFVSLTPPAKGVPPRDHIKLLKGFDGDYDKVAAIIIEPVITDWSQERMDELLSLRKLCDKHKIVLIFDEIITGFRFQKMAVSLYANINPDLILLAKAMANGLPLAAIGGKSEILDGDYFVSSTYAGEVLSLVACKAVCEILSNKKYPDYNADKLWDFGGRFIKKFNAQLGPHLTIEGYPTRGAFVGDPLVKACFMEKAVKANILTGPSWFYNFDLIREDFNFFTFVNEFKHYLERGDLKLEGRMPSSPFASRSRS